MADPGEEDERRANSLSNTRTRDGFFLRTVYRDTCPGVRCGGPRFESRAGWVTSKSIPSLWEGKTLCNQGPPASRAQRGACRLDRKGSSRQTKVAGLVQQLVGPLDIPMHPEILMSNPHVHAGTLASGPKRLLRVSKNTSPGEKEADEAAALRHRARRVHAGAGVVEAGSADDRRPAQQGRGEGPGLRSQC